MRLLDHPNVVQLKNFFYSTTEKDEVYLNLVLDFVPETVYRVLKHFNRMSQHMPIIYVQLYAYQVGSAQPTLCNTSSCTRLSDLATEIYSVNTLIWTMFLVNDLITSLISLQAVTKRTLSYSADLPRAQLHSQCHWCLPS